MGFTRKSGVGALLLVASCKAKACGVNVEVDGPRLKTEAAVRTQGPSLPVPSLKAEYAGVWQGAGLWLVIRNDGGILSRRIDGSGPVTIESSIGEFRADGFTVGVEPVQRFFHVEIPPHREGSDWKMKVDGVELIKIPDYGQQARKYLQGDGVPKDEAKAAELLAKGCDNDDMFCCGMLGASYEHGIGVAKDLRRAAALMAKACAGEDLLSCAVLGGYYANGEGVERDFEKAKQLITKACSGGEQMGCFNLAVLYDQGNGEPSDKPRAAELYASACDRGHAQACANLAIMCEDGEGITKDRQRGLALYQRACQLGHADSCRYITP